MARKQIVASVDAVVKDYYQRLADDAGVSLSWYVSGLLMLEYMENASSVQQSSEWYEKRIARETGEVGCGVPVKKWNGKHRGHSSSLGEMEVVVGTEELKQELSKPSTIQERMAILRSNIQPVEKTPPANVPYIWRCGCSVPPAKMYGGAGWCTRCRKVYPGVRVKE